MNIGILGAGRIERTRLYSSPKLATPLPSVIAGPETLASLTASAANIKAATPEEVVRFGDVILLAIPWSKLDTLPDPQLFENKIVIDALNHYGPNGVVDLGEKTSSEIVSWQIPGARLVKGFNTMYFETLRSGSRPAGPDRLVLFIAGDDTEAKDIVARLIEDIGFAAVDTGFLRDGGRLQQPGSPIYNVPMTVAEARTRLSNL